MAQRARGRGRGRSGDHVAGRGRGQNQKKVRNMDARIPPPAQLQPGLITKGLKSYAEDKPKVMGVAANSTRSEDPLWEWNILEDTDSDEDIVYCKKGVSDLTIFEKLNQHVKTLTPLMDSTVAGLKMSVIPKSSEGLGKSQVFYSVPGSSNL